jgi:tRNA(adenine34) deaminase
MSLEKHEKFMLIAIKEAEKAYKKGEIPIGAIAVLEEHILAKGHNEVISKNDSTAHAEIIVLRKASKRLKNYRLEDVTLYVTVEPCIMCYSALVNARIKALYFGASSDKWGYMTKFGLDSSFYNHNIKVYGGILKYQSEQILKNFFKEKRHKY